MIRVIGLMRHGLATGQAPEAALLPEGADYLRRLAAKLDRESWPHPPVVLSSPYRRARESAQVMVEALHLTAAITLLDELIPESEPAEALAAILAAAPTASPLLVVSHLPLVGRLSMELTGEDPGFSPGTFVEIVREGEGAARLLRKLGPRDI